MPVLNCSEDHSGFTPLPWNAFELQHYLIFLGSVACHSSTQPRLHLHKPLQQDLYEGQLWKKALISFPSSGVAEEISQTEPVL